MHLFQQQPKTSEYTRIPNASAVDDDEAATVLLGTTIRPSPTTTTTTIIGHRSKGWVVMVAGIMLLLLVAGGTVGRLERNDAGRTTTTSDAEGLVVATQGYNELCNAPPMDAMFHGRSTTTSVGKLYHFQTCYQYGNENKYCWAFSYETLGFIHLNYQCMPKPEGGQWHDIDPKYVNPVTTPTLSCGGPCTEMYYG